MTLTIDDAFCSSKDWYVYRDIRKAIQENLQYSRKSSTQPETYPSSLPLNSASIAGSSYVKWITVQRHRVMNLGRYRIGADVCTADAERPGQTCANSCERIPGTWLFEVKLRASAPTRARAQLVTPSLSRTALVFSESPTRPPGPARPHPQGLRMPISCRWKRMRRTAGHGPPRAPSDGEPHGAPTPCTAKPGPLSEWASRLAGARLAGRLAAPAVV